MNLAPLLAAGLLAAASAQHPDVARVNAVASNGANATAPAAAVARTATARPAPGDPAPDFTYQSHDYLWQNLHDMLEQGDVLLVFAGSDEELRALERDREALLASGVVPVAVVMQRETEAWRAVRRYDLAYSLLADPHGAIAEQYGLLDPATQRTVPAWFVIDRHGRVRGTGVPGAGARDVHTASSR